MIEWNKVTEKPDKSYKVLGQNLLDQRNKINDLESNLQTTSSELNAARTRQDQANSKIAAYEKEIEGLEEKASKYDALSLEQTTLQEQFKIMLLLCKEETREADGAFFICAIMMQQNSFGGLEWKKRILTFRSFARRCARET